MRPQRRPRRFAWHDHFPVWLDFFVGRLDHSVFAVDRAVGFRFRLGVHVDRLEEGSGERRRELQQPVGQRGLRLEREPEREQPELQLVLELDPERDRQLEGGQLQHQQVGVT